MIAPREEHFWTKLREALGNPESLARAEYDEAKSRQSHRDELLPVLEDIFVGRDSTDWLETLLAAGVPAAPVNRMPAVFDDPNVAARNMIRSFAVGDTTMHAVGNAIKIVGEDEGEAGPPPTLGHDTDDILRSLLGYDDPAIERLRASGALGQTVTSA